MWQVLFICAPKLVLLQNINSLFVKLYDSLMLNAEFNELPVQPFGIYSTVPCVIGSGMTISSPGSIWDCQSSS